MNDLMPVVPLSLVYPAAEVRQAFDEERAIAEVKEQIALRYESKEEYRAATVIIGNILIAARRAYPGKALPHGVETFSPRFCAFYEKLGFSKSTVTGYMTFAKNPASREKAKQRRDRRRVGFMRNAILTEIRDALLSASKEEVLEAINQELSNAQTNAA